MKFPTPIAISIIADMIHASIHGNRDGYAYGINEIHKVSSGDIVFVDHPKYYGACFSSDASFIIIDQRVDCPSDKTLLVVDEPFEAYLTIVHHFHPFKPSHTMISRNTDIDATAYIAPNVFIGNHVSIGKHTIIQPNVTIMDDCIIGNHVIIQSGTVIGSDAFYYNKKNHREVAYKKMESCGRVLIEDHVEIGANCCVDRGVTHDTIIGKGSKLDNMNHVGHDVVIGKNCLIAAGSAIAGASTLEDDVILWGMVGIAKTTRIGRGTVIKPMSGVFQDVEPGKTIWGIPAIDSAVKMKEQIWMRRMPEIWEYYKQLTVDR
ncbi:MAG: UDP-3-O-(3-hydroxymyristoyl)glucosamine N-acyltransferase [Bacteroidota bacterium]